MSKSDRYICWAKGQMRYVLGDVVTGFVVGFPSGNSGYNRPQDRASSCPSCAGGLQRHHSLLQPAGARFVAPRSCS